jgi:uncharacterized membrane protein
MKTTSKILFAISSLIFLLSSAFSTPTTHAQTTEIPNTIEAEGQVVRVREENLASADPYQIIDVRVTSDGAFEERVFTIDSRESLLEGVRHSVSKGERVKLMIVEVPEQEPIVYVTDIIRLRPLLWLFVLFVFVILAVGWWQGVTSLLGLGATLLIVFGFILPQLLAGRSPLAVTLIGSALLLCIAVFGTHGIRRESVAAFGATLLGIFATGIFAWLFTLAARLSGLGGEDAAVLQLSTDATIDFQGLLLSGIVLGAVGVLDDVAVNQAETVFELKRTDPSLSRRELSERALRIGRHHIASVVNTLVLVYAGASLPLLMLFQTSGQPASELLNAEFLAEEIVRTLVGTIGLILTVPLATWFASAYATKK